MRTSEPSVTRPTIFAILLFALSCTTLNAQDACQAPNLPTGRRAANMFNEKQEVDLGDAMAEHVQHNYRAAPDEQLTGYLHQIADRLLKHMPPTQLHLQFYLVDLGEPNAFNTAGGRIFVSPKIVALAKNEDELAGVIAHELGHLVVHQMAIDMTRNMERLLKVTQVMDRRDIFEKYHQYILAAARKPDALREDPKEEEEDQRLADRVALYAMAGAGYSLDAFADMFERLSGANAKSSSWLAVILSGDDFNGKRLREMIKTTAAIPAACVERAPKSGPDAFKVWQTAVIDFSGWNGQEVLHDVLSRKRFDPPLRGEISFLRYSRDGKYVLAQDEGNVYVLSRGPFAPLFQIEAPDAAPAQFSPDSSQIVFVNRHLRVETWNILSHRRVTAREVIDHKGCLQSNLSPDGSILACLEPKDDGNGAADLVLFETMSGAEVYRKPSFYSPPPEEGSLDWLLILLRSALIKGFDYGYIVARFTPDAHYLLAASEYNKLLIDLTTRQPVPIPKPLNKELNAGFTFLGTDRIAAINKENPAKSKILAFPSGQNLAQVTLGQEIAGVTRGDFVLIRPIEKYAVGAKSISAVNHDFAYARSALDVFDQEFVCEERDAELGIHQVGTLKLLAHADLPGGHLGTLHAAEISRDWKWLAVSEYERGGIWGIDDGSRLHHLVGFQGAYIPNPYVMYADFSKRPKDIIRARHFGGLTGGKPQQEFSPFAGRKRHAIRPVFSRSKGRCQG